MKVAIYSDIVCPWCYVGEHRFRRAAQTAGIPVEITFRPFQLNPDATIEPRPVLDYLRERFGPQADAAHANVARMAQQEGLRFLAGEQLVVSTFDAHRLLRFALLEYGAEKQAALMHRLFEAHFAERANVADASTLAFLAESVGLDPVRARTLLDGDDGTREVRSEMTQALEVGVQAVPTFVLAERYAVQGAQPVETFARVLQQIAKQVAGGALQRTLH